MRILAGLIATFLLLAFLRPMGLPAPVAECVRSALGRSTFWPPAGAGKTTGKVVVDFEPVD